MALSKDNLFILLSILAVLTLCFHLLITKASLKSSWMQQACNTLLMEARCNPSAHLISQLCTSCLTKSGLRFNHRITCLIRQELETFLHAQPCSWWTSKSLRFSVLRFSLASTQCTTWMQALLLSCPTHNQRKNPSKQESCQSTLSPHLQAEPTYGHTWLEVQSWWGCSCYLLT